MNTFPIDIDVTLGPWRIRWQSRERAGWWVQQQGHVQSQTDAQPRGGLADLLRDGPAAYGFEPGRWQWRDLLGAMQERCGEDITAQVLHRRLKALGYGSDGQQVKPQPSIPSQRLM
ncbi:MAG: hypothetical protein RhofKO_29070 [Rhodothermales bacterium]